MRLETDALLLEHFAVQGLDDVLHVVWSGLEVTSCFRHHFVELAVVAGLSLADSGNDIGRIDAVETLCESSDVSIRTVLNGVEIVDCLSDLFALCDIEAELVSIVL